MIRRTDPLLQRIICKLSSFQERMSLQQLRKDAFRKLAKLCAKTSIMEDASK